MKSQILRGVFGFSLLTTMALAITCYVEDTYTCMGAINTCVNPQGKTTSTRMLADAVTATKCKVLTYGDTMGYYDCNNSSITCHQTVHGTQYSGRDCTGAILGTADAHGTAPGFYANLGEPGCYVQ